jgi:hypothetical protein
MRSRGIVLWRRHKSLVGRIINMKRIERGRIVRSVARSSSHIMKMIHSGIMNSISVDVILSENAVSQCKGKENRKGGTSLS